ncbi:lipoprotein [Kushneria pakistanensis]|uniref:Lipoprotein n=1 Tax=Kushneria pakistanensis TaxID=1508770 RepID=A0ABQ3FIQ0_9GAMM|nr:spore coat U domain-containing protein [Kushneria pakistanensis]GHC25740.1 lipoprotein [Kushneria pakistanensis]
MTCRQWLCALMLCAGALCALSVQADCSISNPVGSLGSVPSTQTGQPYQTRVAGGLSCTGTSLQLRAAARARATILDTSNNFALVNEAGDRIAYGLYSDAAFNNQLSGNTPYDFVGLYSSNLPELFSGPGGSVPLYVRTRPTQQLSAGTYRDVVRIQWEYNECIQLSLAGICLSRGTTRTAMALLELSMEITPDCLISAPNIRFGTAPLVAGFSTVSQSLSLFCTKGSSFQVGLSPGSNPLGGERHMVSSSGELLRYRILKPDGTPWRGIGSGLARGHLDADLNPGLGLGGGPGIGGSQSQGFSYRAVIDPDQPTPSPGTYTDQVVITVQF